MLPINSVPDEKNNEAFDILRNAVELFKKQQPLVIGITGAGGAGKTTFGKNIEQFYGVDNCVSIDLDDYLISRSQRGKLGISGYNPKANNLYLARRNINDLRLGKSISKPRYDHSNGAILTDEIVKPHDLIIIEGVTTLYPEMEEVNDISFFLDALEETQIKSRIERDVNIRGYTFDEAMTLYNALKPEYDRWINPTKSKASVIFEVDPDYVMHPIHIAKKLR